MHSFIKINIPEIIYLVVDAIFFWHATCPCSSKSTYILGGIRSVLLLLFVSNKCREFGTYQLLTIHQMCKSNILIQVECAGNLIHRPASCGLITAVMLMTNQEWRMWICACSYKLHVSEGVVCPRVWCVSVKVCVSSWWGLSSWRSSLWWVSGLVCSVTSHIKCYLFNSCTFWICIIHLLTGLVTQMWHASHDATDLILWN